MLRLKETLRFGYQLGLAFLDIIEQKSTIFRRHSHHSWRLSIICSAPATNWAYSHLRDGHFVSLHDDPVEDSLHTGSPCVKWHAVNSWGVQLGWWCTEQCSNMYFGNLTLLLCKTCGATFYCFVQQHGRLITWMQTKNYNAKHEP